MLEYDIEERAKTLATYIIETKSTVRAAAKMFNVSKSTVHKDIAERLEKVNPSLANEAKKVLEINKSERHIRGGLATKMKYSNDKIG
ncbi:Stage III sporulation protein D [compost metagenome]